mmetsp:Transcript_40186/g.82279  ORF Transcript_40186/g.82279 Transcript_40186/m.82279 type:complete len:265 (-) Transcript_40186:786-1580(-)
MTPSPFLSASFTISWTSSAVAARPSFTSTSLSSAGVILPEWWMSMASNVSLISSSFPCPWRLAGPIMMQNSSKEMCPRWYRSNPSSISRASCSLLYVPNIRKNSAKLTTLILPLPSLSKRLKASCSSSTLPSSSFTIASRAFACLGVGVAVRPRMRAKAPKVWMTPFRRRATLYVRSFDCIWGRWRCGKSPAWNFFTHACSSVAFPVILCVGDAVSILVTRSLASAEISSQYGSGKSYLAFLIWSKMTGTLSSWSKGGNPQRRM